MEAMNLPRFSGHIKVWYREGVEKVGKNGKEKEVHARI